MCRVFICFPYNSIKDQIKLSQPENSPFIVEKHLVFDTGDLLQGSTSHQTHLAQ